jgi:hypothetical protein
MTPEQIANIGVSGKGYWLFDRNDYNLNKNEAIRASLTNTKMLRATITYTAQHLGLTEPWAIYKWIPYHRS